MNMLSRLQLSMLAILVLTFGLSGNLHAGTPADKREGYISTNGGKLFYSQYGIKSKQPVIVLHGGPGLDQSYLLPQMQELAANNQVIFYDQRGSGRSLGFALDAHSINMKNFVKDLEAVRKQFGYKKIILVGHSWGGLLAMRYAILYPDRVSKLILVSSAPADYAGFKSFFAEYEKRTAPLKHKLDNLENSTEFKHGDPTTVIEYYRTVFATYFYQPTDVSKLSLYFTQQSALNGRKIGQIFGETYLNRYDLKPELKKLSVPTLIIHGVNDIVPITTARETHAAIASSQIVELKDCDHFPYIEQPKEFFKVIAKFLRLDHNT